MARLPNSNRAILDIRKIEDYCLDPRHPRGRHKARVFRDTLGIGRADSQWFRAAILARFRKPKRTSRRSMRPVAAGGSTFRSSDKIGKLWYERFGSFARVKIYPAFRNLLGAMMTDTSRTGKPSVLDVVALLTDRPEALARGQVGTVVELLDNDTVLVEFSDDEGRAYAITPCPHDALLVLHYEPEEV